MRFASCRRGVTLIELLVVLVIGGLISGAVVALLMGQIQLSSTQNRAMINQGNLRDSLDYVSDEISTIGTGCTEPYVSIAAAQEFQFVTDVDGDGNWNRVRYYLSNGSLRRQLWSSANAGVNWTQVSDDELLGGVTSLTFTYFQRGNTAAPNTDLITLIEVKLTQNAAYQTTAFTSGKVATGKMAVRATIRNRMMN